MKQDGPTKRILIANDHGGVDLKKRLMQHLLEKHILVENLGVDSSESVDYPDIADAACRQFLQGGYDFGILICGTGIGISISANRISGIRCALVHDEFTAEMAKAHNDANFIAFGGRVTYTVPVEKILDAYMNAEVDQNERHRRRVDKIDAISGHPALH